MSQYPGGPPPYYPGQPPPHWPHPPPHPGTHPGHPPPPGPYPPQPYPYYVPGAVMVPVPMPMPMQPMPVPDQGHPTYITNHIYGDSSNVDQNQVSMVEHPGEYDWVATTAINASTLTGRAVVGGHEGWDGSPLWVIRAWHMGDVIPGKLSVRHNAASVMYNGKEVPVQNIEVLCAKPEDLRWVSATNGSIPPGAIPGGRTASGETLYVGRARYQLSVTPGKVHPSHKSCYIGFSGQEVAMKMYDVLCRVS